MKLIKLEGLCINFNIFRQPSLRWHRRSRDVFPVRLKERRVDSYGTRLAFLPMLVLRRFSARENRSTVLINSQPCRLTVAPNAATLPRTLCVEWIQLNPTEVTGFYVYEYCKDGTRAISSGGRKIRGKVPNYPTGNWTRKSLNLRLLACVAAFILPNSYHVHFE